MSKQITRNDFAEWHFTEKQAAMIERVFAELDAATLRLDIHERLETDVGAAAWITEWLVADKFCKPDIPVWLDKARKHYRETVAKNYRLTAEVSRLLNIHNTGNEYDESERNARLKSEVTVLNNAIIDILMTVRKYTSVSFATRKAKRS